MKRLTKKEIAKTVDVSLSHLCDIFNGKKPAGRKTSEKISKFLHGRKWFHVVDMKPETLEAALREALGEGKDAEIAEDVESMSTAA